MPHSGHFDLDIPVAIHDQLVESFVGLDPVLLSEWGVLAPPPRRGVYGLHYEGVLVYVGKADDLERRLGEHQAKLAGRQNIAPDVVGATFLTVNPNWSAYAPEAVLVRHFRNIGLCEWNGSGFGNHDVGRRRDTSAPNDFDRRFPVRLDWPCTHITAGVYDVSDLLASVKAELPYLLRYDKTHPDLAGVTVALSASAPTFRSVMRAISAALPGWQATALPSHVILYLETRSYGEALGVVL